MLVAGGICYNRGSKGLELVSSVSSPVLYTYKIKPPRA